MQAITYTRSEVVALLGLQPRSHASARRKINTLIVEAGFPRPLPRLRVWSKLLVDSWIEAGGLTAEAPGRPDYIATTRRRFEAGILARNA